MVNEGRLVLLRHGESVLNAQDRFTGLLDVPLTGRGEKEAADAAALLAKEQLLPDVVYVSPLQRAVRTCDIMLEQLHRTGTRRIVAWQLMERNYGALSGQPRTQVYAQYGSAQFLQWRRGRGAHPPPLDASSLQSVRAQPALSHVPARALTPSESLADVIARTSVIWEAIAAELRTGLTVLVITHGNTLRALCSILDDLTENELAGLNIPTGEPLLYTFDEQLHPRRRGGSYLDHGRAQLAATALEQLGGT